MFHFLASIFSGIAYAGAVLLWNLGLAGAPMLPEEKPATAAVVQQVPVVKVITEKDVIQEEVENLKKELAAIKQQKSVTITTASKPAVETQKQLTNKEIIAKIKPAVVYITTPAGATGTGMIIDKDGFVLTSAHVIEDAMFVDVKLPDGRVFAGTIIGWNAENTDLAIIQLGSSGSVLPVVEFGNSTLVEQGDPVFTFGYPLGLEGDVSFKEGTISRRHALRGKEYLEMSADILPGNSGGPLVDDKGRVIGINTRILGEGIRGIIFGESIKFAIPIDYAKTFIPHLRLGMGLPAGFLSPAGYSMSISPSPSPTPSPASNPLPPLGSTIRIGRNIVMAADINPELICKQLTFVGEELRLCELYKNYKDSYSWEIVD